MTGKAATPHTISANSRVLGELPFHDRTDFEDADRGFLAGPTGDVTKADGTLVWSFSRWDFLEGDAPETVNPSLWRQSQLSARAGLYEVVDGIYQVRGFDLSVVSYLRGERGWIVVDPLISLETMAAAHTLVSQHLGERPVRAVIYTHSHIDHFGGVRALASEDDVGEGGVRIIAPVDFMEESVSENVMLGNAMSRRASYMYGNLVGYDARGAVGAGLGQLTSAGTPTLLAPTDIISETGQELTVDGLRIVFQHTPGAEAPAELCFYLPEQQALCMAEIATHTLHNVYTLRGAKIRDAKAWSQHNHDALRLFGDDAAVVFASHHWPTWGNAAVRAFLTGQRDLYRYLHDETLRLANHGLTPVEIAEEIELPAGIARSFANRGYYGSINHNVKATYTYYLGWFDGNPANLHPPVPTEAARKTVEYMGGAAAVIERARVDFEAGEYRWVAKVLNEVVFADPDHQEARELLADTFEQLGYQAENGTWRDFYLTGARELREGVAALPAPSTASPDLVRAMTVPMLLDYLAVRLNGPKAASKAFAFELVLSDAGERYLLEVGNGVLIHTRDAAAAEPTATIRLARAALDAITLGQSTFEELMRDGTVEIDGDASAFTEFLGLLDTFELWFDIVTP